MLMKPEQLNLPDIKFFPFPRTMVKFLPQIWKIISRPTTQTEAMITWFFQAWFIFHIRQNTELFTQSRNWQIFPVYAGNMRSRYSWMEPDWAMDWWQRQMWLWKILQIIQTYFISEEPRLVPCAVKLSFSRRRHRNISLLWSNSRERFLRKADCLEFSLILFSQEICTWKSAKMLSKPLQNWKLH